jgi:AMIN domain
VKNFAPDFAPKPRFGPSRSGYGLRAELRALLALAVLAFAVSLLRAQTPNEQAIRSSSPAVSAAVKSAAGKVAAVTSFRVVQEKDGQAIEILSTRPLVPSIQAITDPDRLVIDLPNARLDTAKKRISVQADQISTLRADQFQQNPPVARVVVDLLAPRSFTWDAAGNRLVVHLGKAPSEVGNSPFEPPTVPALTSAPKPAIASVRAAGPLTFSGNVAPNNTGSGSSITAGADTAILNLSSGGEVRVCPGTTVSVTPSQNRHNVMLGMNTGALEAHLALDASSDSIMTPDFRILLAGPGEFHYAVSADNHGNTCVRALPGNTASAIVSELLGDRTYQVKPADQLVFRSGQIDRVDMAVPLECGCPPPHDAPMRATSEQPAQSDLPSKEENAALPSLNANPPPPAENAHNENAAPTGIPAAAAPPDAAAAANELHVQVEAPLVFHAPAPPPLSPDELRALPLDSRPRTEMPSMTPLAPPADEAAETASSETPAKRAHSRGFFRRVGGFFASLLH